MYGNCPVCGARFGNEEKNCEHIDMLEAIFSYFTIWCKDHSKKPDDISNIQEFVVELYKRKKYLPEYGDIIHMSLDAEGETYSRIDQYSPEVANEARGCKITILMKKAEVEKRIKELI